MEVRDLWKDMSPVGILIRNFSTDFSYASGYRLAQYSVMVTFHALLHQKTSDMTTRESLSRASDELTDTPQRLLRTIWSEIGQSGSQVTNKPSQSRRTSA